MMKAAQGPSGGGGALPLGAPNAGSHSPNHQSMHPGEYKTNFFKILLI